MNNSGNIAEQRQEDVEPEMQADADLQKNAERRQDNGSEYANDVHVPNPSGFHTNAPDRSCIRPQPPFSQELSSPDGDGLAGATFHGVLGTGCRLIPIAPDMHGPLRLHVNRTLC
jgi:hypothetical protein